MTSIGEKTESDAQYFLDTSTVIAFHWGTPETRVKVMADLSGAGRQSSVYVKCQYKTRILNSAILAHTLAESSSTLDDARQRAEKLKGEFDSLAYEVLRRLFNVCETKDKLVRRLERMICVDWRNQFVAVVGNDLCDLTRCTLASDAPKQSGKFYENIGKGCPANCGISAFWIEKGYDLAVLASLDPKAYDGANDPKGTIRAILEQARRLRDGKSAHGSPCRQVLDDVTIAIEARDSYEDTVIHSMDHDFELLSPHLDVRVRVPD
jgi:hypothetical protein